MIELKQKLDIYLEPETIKILEKEAYRVGLTISHLVQRAIEDKYIKLYTTEKEVIKHGNTNK